VSQCCVRHPDKVELWFLSLGSSVTTLGNTQPRMTENKDKASGARFSRPQVVTSEARTNLVRPISEQWSKGKRGVLQKCCEDMYMYSVSTMQTTNLQAKAYGSRSIAHSTLNPTNIKTTSALRLPIMNPCLLFPSIYLCAAGLSTCSPYT
jgi:hypothetical protein